MTELEQASRTLGSALALLDYVAAHGKANRVDEAYKLLSDVNRDFNEASPLLSAQIAEWTKTRPIPLGPVVFAGIPHTWSSGHEAARYIVRRALEVLYWPAVSDDVLNPKTKKIDRVAVAEQAECFRRAELILSERWELCDIPAATREIIDERIRHERANLAATAPATTPPKKRGPKVDPARDRRIYDEYYRGLEDGLWLTQAEFVDKRYKGKSEAWFTQLKKRVEKVK